MKKYIVITGGELFNKGAQAMTFSVISTIKQINPDMTCVLLSTKDYTERSEKEKEIYDFLILPYQIREVLYGIGGLYKISSLKRKINKEYVATITNILHNCNMMLDISGYVLSSDWGKRRCQSFLLKILIAKKYKIPVYVMPQSFGPFKFKRLDSFIIDKMIKYIMPYPELIYAREEQGYKILTEKYGLKNVKKSVDIVLLTEGIDSKLIYKMAPKKKNIDILDNSVGIIPNKRTMEHGNRERIIDLYIDIIETLLDLGKEIYLISHSVDDEVLCKELKDKYQTNSKIIHLRLELSCIDFEEMIKKFDYIIASRYHAIIHAYKHSVPCVILGWAVKYNEVANVFGQGEYIFDISDDFSGVNIIKSIAKMDILYKREAKIIKEKLIKYRSEKVFDCFKQLGEIKK